MAESNFIDELKQDMKNEFWWTIEFSMPLSGGNTARGEEILSTIATLTDALGSFIFIEDGKLFLRADYESSQEFDELLFKVKHYLDMPDFKDVTLTRCYKTDERPWDTQHYDAFPPLEVGKKLIVTAPWHEKAKHIPGRTVINVYPAGAFGTGYHESTQIALTLLEEIVKFGDIILDVGTGTGILFIAALKLGAGKAIARDIDPDAIDEAWRNVNLNGINPKVCEISQGDLLKNFKEEVNIMTSNILLKPNVSMLPDVKSVLKPKGHAIFSGMTTVESEMFLSVLEASGLSVEKELKIGDWWGCRAVKAWG